MAIYGEQVTPNPISVHAGTAFQLAGGLISLALIAGVAVWGYQLVVRDVSGIPVVRAMEGDMRVVPTQPGGNVALHAGLSVNAVAAEGEAAGPEDVLLLAPATTQLAEEDLAVQPMAEARELQPVDPAPLAPQTNVTIAVEPNLPEGPMSTDDILALADQIAAGAMPLTELAEGEDVAPQVLLNGAAVTQAGVPAIDPAIPGVAVSPRPNLRPAQLASAVAAPSSTQDVTPNATAAQTVAPSTQVLPAGTHLVQLGAFPTAEQAVTEWSRLSGRFAEYLGAKQQLIQEATSGGQTFYRLRARGFETAGDARRFCAAMQAGNADCIPVVVQ